MRFCFLLLQNSVLQLKRNDIKSNFELTDISLCIEESDSYSHVWMQVYAIVLSLKKC